MAGWLGGCGFTWFSISASHNCIDHCDVCGFWNDCYCCRQQLGVCSCPKNEPIVSFSRCLGLGIAESVPCTRNDVGHMCTVYLTRVSQLTSPKLIAKAGTGSPVHFVWSFACNLESHQQDMIASVDPWHTLRWVLLAGVVNISMTISLRAHRYSGITGMTNSNEDADDMAAGSK